jgi:hypothetical protein
MLLPKLDSIVGEPLPALDNNIAKPGEAGCS